MLKKKNTYRKEQQNKTRILFGLRGRRVGFCCGLGRHLEHCTLSYTFALGVFLNTKGKGDQCQFLALGSSLLFGEILGHKRKLGWHRGYLFC